VRSRLTVTSKATYTEYERVVRPGGDRPADWRSSGRLAIVRSLAIVRHSGGDARGSRGRACRLECSLSGLQRSTVHMNVIDAVCDPVGTRARGS
jgi:hypothetical protein